MNSEELKREIIHAGRRAVEQLIKVAKEDIIKPDPDDELAADRLKNAAATKKLAIFDAFEILSKIDSEEEVINSDDTWVGYNPRLKEIVNMLDSGIVDPTKVTRLALENAASVAGTMLITETVISNIKEKDSKSIDPNMMM